MNDQPEMKRTGCDDPGFQLLISRLDHELWNELHENQATYDQFNQVTGIQTAIIVYVNGKPAGIGCFKEFDKDTVEIKRMFVEKEFRGRGLSKYVLSELEQWALESGYQYAVLETSVRFRIAQNLYASTGYETIENYGQYKGLTESVCMKKDLKPHSPGAEKGVGKEETHRPSPFFGRKDIEYFSFEEDFVERNIRCIPMIVRYKMDKAGIKLKLNEWNKFSEKERIELAKWPFDHADEIKVYHEFLAGLIRNNTGNAPTNMDVEQYPAWDNTDTVPLEIAERMNEIGLPVSSQRWKALTQLQRFALVKLSRPGHESKNFSKALKEFGLMPLDQKMETDFLSG